MWVGNPNAASVTGNRVGGDEGTDQNVGVFRRNPGRGKGRGTRHPAAGGRALRVPLPRPLVFVEVGGLSQKVKVVEGVPKNRTVGVLKLTAVFYLHPNENVL